MTATPDPIRILDSALNLAEERSWEAVRLYDVAAATGMTLDDIRIHFREKEDLVEAWFDRADAAMLRDAGKPDFFSLSTRERLQQLITTWLDTLAPHRQVTRQMILAKCEPGHLHIQIPAVMRISRTVQWMREAAHQDATYLARALEETVLTGIYLTTFIYWMRDESLGSTRTRYLLASLLRAAEAMALWLPGFGSKNEVPAVSRPPPIADRQEPD
jgi:AcrR family transcriptional regulator